MNLICASIRRLKADEFEVLPIGPKPNPPPIEFDVPKSVELKLPIGVPALTLLNRFCAFREKVRLYFLPDEAPPPIPRPNPPRPPLPPPALLASPLASPPNPKVLLSLRLTVANDGPVP